jgi:type I restriction enzyme S subunit
MADWIEKTLGEVTSFIAKGIPPKYSEEESKDTIRVLNQKCNRNFEISYSESRIHDCAQKKVPTDKMLKVGDVLINSTGTGTAGRVAQMMEVTAPTTIDGHMILLRPSEELDPIYYGYALKSHQSQIEGLAEGSTGQTEINRRRLQDEVIICYPSDKSIQKNIGNFLANIDGKIKTNTAINENLADQIQAIYSNEFDPNTHRSSGVLADVCSYSSDRIPVSDLSVSTYFSTENMQPNKMGSVNAASLPSITLTTGCHKGDVLISNIRPYFKKIVYVTDNSCGCSTDVLCFVPQEDQYSAFLFGTLYMDRFFDYMVAGSKGTKMPRGDKQQIMNYPVVLPDKESLNFFNGLIVPMLDQIATNRTESYKLVALRDAILPKLMSGEIDVSALDL